MEEMAQLQYLCGRSFNFPLLLYLPEQSYGHAHVLDSCRDGMYTNFSTSYFHGSLWYIGLLIPPRSLLM
jgi:hypothetical protein